jgi:hypothetical protein
MFNLFCWFHGEFRSCLLMLLAMGDGPDYNTRAIVRVNLPAAAAEALVPFK